MLPAHTTGAVVLAALLGASALAVPTPVRAQSVTPERALMNALEVSQPGAVATLAQATHVPVRWGLVDGERALLNRAGTTGYQPIDRPEATHTVVPSGPYPQAVRALLNRSGS